MPLQSPPASGSYPYSTYSETSLIRHSVGLDKSVGLGGCWITKGLLAYLNMVTVPHKMVVLERMSDYRDFTVRVFDPLSSVQQVSVEHDDMFEEIPLKIKTSKLGSVLLCELEGRSDGVQTFDFLSLATRLVVCVCVYAVCVRVFKFLKLNAYGYVKQVNICTAKCAVSMCNRYANAHLTYSNCCSFYLRTNFL